VSRIIVKQALPYVRCVGESWPLTLDRARLEAQTLVEHYQHSPQHTVKIHHFDPELAVMVMEDLSSHRIWRGELIKNIYYPQAARQLGEYLAHTLFHTSDFYLHPHEKKRRWRNSSTRRCARSPKICSSTIRTRSTSATTTRPSWKMTSPPCATTPS
jgi:5-methylthioribose kinase